MKRYLAQVNSLIATPMLLIYLTNLTFFAQMPSLLNYQHFNKLENVLEQINMIFYLFYTAVMWTICAQIHSEVPY